jgi:hypothetical protein
MTTKGKQATVAIVARRVRALEERIDPTLKRLESNLKSEGELLEDLAGRTGTLTVEGERIERDAYDLRRQVADLEGRIRVLEAPFWRRRRVRFEELANRLARQKEHARIVEDQVAADADLEAIAAVQTDTPAAVVPGQPTGRVVELEGSARVTKRPKETEPN